MKEKKKFGVQFLKKDFEKINIKCKNREVINYIFGLY